MKLFGSTIECLDCGNELGVATYLTRKKVKPSAIPIYEEIHCRVCGNMTRIISQDAGRTLQRFNQLTN